MAFDPVQKILAIGTNHGALRLYPFFFLLTSNKSHACLGILQKLLFCKATGISCAYLFTNGLLFFGRVEFVFIGYLCQVELSGIRKMFRNP